jgi:hypothetical protein
MTFHEDCQAFALRLALERAGLDPSLAPTMKLTHDQQLVFPPDAALPTGATGFVQCRLQGGAYSTWLEPDDQPRSKADYTRIEGEARALRTKDAAFLALRAIGVSYPGGKLRHMKTQYRVHRMAQLWPLRENTPAPQPSTDRRSESKGYTPCHVTSI